VRQVTQENRGKRTPGVDGVAALTAKQRLRLAGTLRRLTGWAVAPIRRVYIPKPNSPNEKRGLGIPVMADRALQALVKQALEPEWEAVFEANSYGFRPGRSAHDAIEAIFNAICLKPKFVLDADIEKCFDRISHDALLVKLHAPQPVMRLVRGWLKAQVVDRNKRLFPEAGTPQGGVISPLLANVALHGLESAVVAVSRRARRPYGGTRNRYEQRFVNVEVRRKRRSSRRSTPSFGVGRCTIGRASPKMFSAHWTRRRSDS
jgi:RNA-directed DNA polymerase